MSLDKYFGAGNIYVLDNDWLEAKPIVDSLYKNQLPHIYIDGSLNSLPKEPKQIRLLFLDLNLKDSANPMDTKSFKSMHSGILGKLIANQACSYIILVWSKQEDLYLKSFIEIFNDKDDSYGLNDKKPHSIVVLNKKDFFQTKEVDGVISFEWIMGKEEELQELIINELDKNQAFKLLSAWENVVLDSSNKTVDYLFDLVKDVKEDEVNTKLDSIITSLSISYLGKTFFTSNHQEKTDAFMLALSELIDDEIDKEIILKKQPEFSNWSKKRIDAVERAKINSKLLTSIENLNNHLTGSIFKADTKRHNFKKMLFECFGKDRKSVDKVINRKLGEKKIKDPTREDKFAMLNEHTDDLLSDLSKFIPIELNLTPLCDVVQKKQEYYRIVPGFLIQSKILKECFTETDRNFYSPLMYSQSGINEFNLVLDYRYLYSITQDELVKKKKMCNLRKSFVDEIQLKLSNHVSRLGLLYIN